MKNKLLTTFALTAADASRKTQRALTLFLLILTISVSGFGQLIRWAGESVPSDGLRSNILHAPDNAYTTFSAPVTVRNFGSVMRYKNIHRLLGVSREVPARADVIAFEGNGGSGAGPFNGWESSVWTFSDGTNTRTVSYNELVGPASDPAVIATGTFENADYRTFFGMCTPNPSKISYLLFDLHSTSPAIDTESPNFSIYITNSIFGEGTPDPDAIGIFSACQAE